MKKDKTEIIQKILKLENQAGLRNSKYRRNLRLFEYSPTISLNNMADSQVVGYYQQGYFEQEDDTTSSIQENVIRSCIETLVSKIASQKVRPFFNTTNASYKEMQIVKQAQTFFDNLYDEINMNKIISEIFRDACVFDTGVLYLDIPAAKFERCFPWQVFTDSREVSYGKIVQAVRKREQFPATLLDVPNKNNVEQVTYYEYWNTKEKAKYIYIPELNYVEKEAYDNDKVPFLFLHFSNPVKGSTCSSITDMLYGIQMEIDSLLTKIKDASQLSAPLKFFVPEQSTIKVDKLSNRTGEIITYTALPGMTGSPVTTATEPFMDPSWMQTLEELKEHAYELVGISQLSSMAKKPQGLDSGVAIGTFEDVESDRWEIQLNNVVRMYVDAAKLAIELLPEDANILPPYRMRGNFTWKDLEAAKDIITIQFSAAESLSKDPSTKLQQLMQFAQAGLIPMSRIPQLMELPDMEQGFSLAQSNINAVMNVISNCIENDDYNIPDFVQTESLQTEILNTCLQLKAVNNPQNEIDIGKLTKLFQIAEKKKVDAMSSAEMAAVTSLASELQNQMPIYQQRINEGMQQADEQAKLITEQGNAISTELQRDNYII